MNGPSGGFLKTTVGRRLFWRFLLAAFLPTAATAGLAWYAVQGQMRSGIEARISQDAKLSGLNTLGALQRLDGLLTGHMATYGATSAAAPPGFEEIIVRPVDRGLPGQAPDEGRALTPEQLKHLASGRTIIAVSAHDGALATWMAISARSAQDSATVVWARLSNRALWEATAEAIRKDGTQLCVIEAQRESGLYCEEELPATALESLRDLRGTGRLALASWSAEGRARYSASWNVFLRYEYAAPDWQVIVTESGEAIFATLGTFMTTIAGISVLALLVVFLLSHSQIRRSTEPLEQLSEGTRRLASGDFRTRVVVQSGDEFGELADSFNGMASTLDRQIVTLRSLDALHAAVLGAREIPPLLETALSRIAALTPAAHVLVAVADAGGATEAMLRRADSTGIARLAIDLHDEDRSALEAQAGMISFDAKHAPAFLAASPFTDPGHHGHLVPLVREGKLLGFVVLVSRNGDSLNQDQLEAVRRLADRLALAIADVQNVRHLAALSEGTLTAFARAIDANSPWTAGHSERVTAVGMVIGTRLGLSSDELADLRCGGLLHDIGKIGVPPQILDKAAPLNEAERAVIERHPVLGAEILAPIAAFNRAVPIVRSHHEKMNGSGYPDGLIGNAIPHLARVLAVADVFDALVSDRPYRSGLGVPRAVEIIQRGARSHFDPDAVSAFLSGVKAGEVEPLIAVRSTAAQLASAVVAGRRAMEDAA